MPNVKPYNYQQIHDRRLAESICVAAVVSVTAFDPRQDDVDVQPLSKHLQNGKYESQPPILSIPVACTRSGGFIIRPWIKAGDVGVVLYLDHDMDSTVSGAKEAQPLTERNHATTDAVFVGGIVAGGYTVQGSPAKHLSSQRMTAASTSPSRRARCKSRATSTWRVKSRPHRTSWLRSASAERTTPIRAIPAA